MIIDTHVHVLPDVLAEKAVAKLSASSHLAPTTNETISDTLAKMQANNIDLAVCLNIAVKPNQDKKVNDFAIANNEGKLVMFGSVNPYSDNVVEELERLKNAGIKGIKLHPEYQQFYVDDSRCDIIYETCGRLGLIIVFHAGFDSAYPTCRHASARRLAKVVKKYPNTTFVLAHLGAMLWWRSVYRNIAGLNCYLDTAMIAGFLKPKLARKIIMKHGVDRVLFATDTPWCAWDKAIAYIDSLGLIAEEREKIMYKNALKLLGMERL